MSDGDRYHSIPERITWTTGFRQPIDKHVLGVLSTFASFKTGLRADMALETLIARAKVGRRRVLRSLKRLIDDGFVKAWKRHRRPTVYDIQPHKLATHWREMKAVQPKPTASLSDTRVTQEGLSDTCDRLGDTSVTQDPVLSDTSVTPSPVRTDPQFDHKGADGLPRQLSLPPQDVGPEAPRFDASSVIAQMKAHLATPVSDAHARRRRHGGG